MWKQLPNLDVDNSIVSLLTYFNSCNNHKEEEGYESTQIPPVDEDRCTAIGSIDGVWTIDR